MPFLILPFFSRVIMLCVDNKCSYTNTTRLAERNHSEVNSNSNNNTSCSVSREHFMFENMYWSGGHFGYELCRVSNFSLNCTLCMYMKPNDHFDYFISEVETRIKFFKLLSKKDNLTKSFSEATTEGRTQMKCKPCSKHSIS